MLFTNVATKRTVKELLLDFIFNGQHECTHGMLTTPKTLTVMTPPIIFVLVDIHVFRPRECVDGPSRYKNLKHLLCSSVYIPNYTGSLALTL